MKLGKKVARTNGDIILAFGEVTGHAHRIKGSGCELFEIPDTDDRFLKIMETSFLTHEEHGTLTLEPKPKSKKPLRQGDVLLYPREGGYEVRIKRVYTSKDMAPIRVTD